MPGGVREVAFLTRTDALDSLASKGTDAFSYFLSFFFFFFYVLEELWVWISVNSTPTQSVVLAPCFPSSSQCALTPSEKKRLPLTAQLLPESAPADVQAVYFRQC